MTGPGGCGKSFVLREVLQTLPKESTSATSTTGITAVSLNGNEHPLLAAVASSCTMMCTGSTIFQWAGCGLVTDMAENLAKKIASSPGASHSLTINLGLHLPTPVIQTSGSGGSRQKY